MKALCKELTARNYTNKEITVGKEYEVIEELPKKYIRVVNDKGNRLNYPIELFDITGDVIKINYCPICGKEAKNKYCSKECYKVKLNKKGN